MKYSPTKVSQSKVSPTKASASWGSHLPVDHKFRNPELEAKTAQIQAEFEALLKEAGPAGRISPRKGGHEDLKMDDFYQVMGSFYSSDMKKHKSPTKRLIKQKDTAFAHKELMSRDLHRTQSYGLTYISSPDKSYVIEPKGGELNYDMAYKNPLKFYDKVLN